MIGRVLTVVAVLSVLTAGGSVWLLVRDGQGRRRASSARVLRRLAGTSVLVVLATLVGLRPWYWDVAVAAVAAAGFLAIVRLLTALRRRPLRGWGPISLALAAVLLGSGLVTMGGTAAVLDAAALSGGDAVPVDHGGPVLADAVVYQLFWGPSWATTPRPPTLGRAVSFEEHVSPSPWERALVASGFGVRSLVPGGCWIDSTPTVERGRVSSMVAGALPQELRRVFQRSPQGPGRPLADCPGAAPASVPAALPRDALVVVWLDSSITYALDGVSIHGAVPWPGRAHGLAVSALTDGYATWRLPGCGAHPACRALSDRVSPTYALSHEIVETIANPYGSGWYADTPLRWSARYVLDHGPPSLLRSAPMFPGEVADLCEPGQPASHGGRSMLSTGPGGSTVAAFFRPARGCVA